MRSRENFERLRLRPLRSILSRLRFRPQVQCPGISDSGAVSDILNITARSNRLIYLHFFRSRSRPVFNGLGVGSQQNALAASGSDENKPSVAALVPAPVPHMYVCEECRAGAVAAAWGLHISLESVAGVAGTFCSKSEPGSET